MQAYLARQPQAVRADMAATRLLADITRPLSQPIAATTTTLDSECYHGARLPSIAQAGLQVSGHMGDRVSWGHRGDRVSWGHRGVTVSWHLDNVMALAWIMK